MRYHRIIWLVGLIFGYYTGRGSRKEYISGRKGRYAAKGTGVSARNNRLTSVCSRLATAWFYEVVLPAKVTYDVRAVPTRKRLKRGVGRLCYHMIQNILNDALLLI